MRDTQLADMTVGEIMATWPATIHVFVARRMHCVGCPISPFHTLAEAAGEHAQDLEELTREVLAATGAPRAGPAGGRRR